MNPSVTDILIRPDAFFRDRINSKEDLKFPVLIVLAGSLVAAAYGYLIGGLTARMMASAMPGIETVILLSSVIGAVIGTFLFWLIWSGVIYLLSIAFRGTGSFRRVLEVVGYGYLPQLFGTLITLIVAIQYIPRITVPTITSAGLQDPAVSATGHAGIHAGSCNEGTYPDQFPHHHCLPSLECQYLDLRDKTCPECFSAGCGTLRGPSRHRLYPLHDV